MLIYWILWFVYQKTRKEIEIACIYVVFFLCLCVFVHLIYVFIEKVMKKTEIGSCRFLLKRKQIFFRSFVRSFADNYWLTINKKIFFLISSSSSSPHIFLNSGNYHTSGNFFFYSFYAHRLPQFSFFLAYR